VRLDPRTDRRWEAFVRNHPDGLIYHHPNWLRVLTREYPADPVGLACEDLRGQLRGVLALLPTRGLPLASGPRTTRRLSSLPRTPVAGPLALDDAARRQLVHAALQLVQQEAGTRLEIKAPTSLSISAAAGLLKTPWRLSYRLALPADPSALRFGDSRSHGRIRWALNKAQKLGVRVRPAESVDDLRRWYAIHLETMRWHSVPPRPLRLFQAMWEILRPVGQMRLLLAEQHEGGQTRLLAGSVFLMLGETVFYAFNGCRRSAMPLRANDVIQWEAIHDAVVNGFRHYDLGEVEEQQEGLHEFKSKWGSQASRLYRYYDPAADIRPGESESRGQRRVARIAWQRMPASVTALLADKLYGYM
jgi:hypothetical protein